jgi:hypothetical protein
MGAGCHPEDPVVVRALPGEEAKIPETLFGNLLNDINFPYPF